MSGGGSSGKQTVINETKPDPFTQQWRGQLYSAAQDQYNQGVQPYFPGSTVVPFSQQTQAGLNMLQNQAMHGAPNYNQANTAMARALSGYNPAMPYAQTAAQGGLFNSGLQGVQDASQIQTAPQIQGMIGQGTQQNPWAALSGQMAGQQTTAGVQPLQQAANGGAMNPYLDSLFGAASQPVMNAVNAQFSNAGRTNSGAHAGAMTRELGNLATQIYAPAYEAERGRQLQSATTLAGLQQNDLSRNLSALGQAGSLFENASGRQLSGAGLYGDALNLDAGRRYQGATDIASLFESGLDRQMQGAEQIGNLWGQGNADAARAAALQPSLFQYGQMPGQAMLDLGGMYEGQAQNYLNDAMARYYYPQQQAQQNLQNYANILNGLPDFSGSATQQTGPGTNRLMSGLGGAAMGGGLADMLGLTMTANPVALPFLIGGGALAGLFG